MAMKLISTKKLQGLRGNNPVFLSEFEPSVLIKERKRKLTTTENLTKTAKQKRLLRCPANCQVCSFLHIS
jgi:hypothetical protein